MQPLHTWGDIGGADISFEKAAAIAAAAVSAASASASEPSSSPASSNVDNVSQYFVQNATLNATLPDPAPIAATSDTIRSANFLLCGDSCDKVGCRTMRYKHNRRLVCTKCMPPESYKTCTQQGCKNVIHADCMHDKEIQTWTCRSCTDMKRTNPAAVTTGSSC